MSQTWGKDDQVVAVEWGRDDPAVEPSTKLTGSVPTIQNPDGTSSSELTIGVEAAELNKGRPTLIPTIVDGKQLSNADAIGAALKSGLNYPWFQDYEAMGSYAAKRSESGGAVKHGFLGQKDPWPEPHGTWEPSWEPPPALPQPPDDGLRGGVLTIQPEGFGSFRGEAGEMGERQFTVPDQWKAPSIPVTEEGTFIGPGEPGVGFEPEIGHEPSLGFTGGQLSRGEKFLEGARPLEQMVDVVRMLRFRLGEQVGEALGVDEYREKMRQSWEEMGREAQYKQQELGGWGEAGAFVGMFLDPTIWAAFGIGTKLTKPLADKILTKGLTRKQVYQVAISEGWKPKNATRLANAVQFMVRHSISGAGGMAGYEGIMGAGHGGLPGLVQGTLHGAKTGAMIGPAFGAVGYGLGMTLKGASWLMTPIEARRILKMPKMGQRDLAEAYNRSAGEAAGRGDYLGVQKAAQAHDTLLWEQQQLAPVGTPKRRAAAPKAEPTRAPSPTRPVRDKQPWLMSKDEAGQDPRFRLAGDMGETVARVEPDGRIALSDAYFGHSPKQRREVLRHEFDHPNVDPTEKRFWEVVDSGELGRFNEQTQKWEGIAPGRNPEETLVNLFDRVRKGGEVPAAVLEKYPEITPARKPSATRPVREVRAVQAEVAEHAAVPAPAKAPEKRLFADRPELRTREASFQTPAPGGDNRSFKITTKQGDELIAFAGGQDMPGGKFRPEQGEIFFARVRGPKRRGTATAMATDALRIMQAEGATRVIMRVPGTADGKAFTQSLVDRGLISKPVETHKSGTTLHDILVDRAPAKAEAAAPPKPAKKQPWEMTREEFGKSLSQYEAYVVSKEGNVFRSTTHPTAFNKLEAAGDTIGGSPETGFAVGDILVPESKLPKTQTVTKDTTDTLRKLTIEAALRQGKPVPAEVLKDYPDLAKPAPQPAAAKAVEPKSVPGQVKEAIIAVRRAEAAEQLNALRKNEGLMGWERDVLTKAQERAEKQGWDWKAIEERIRQETEYNESWRTKGEQSGWERLEARRQRGAEQDRVAAKEQAERDALREVEQEQAKAKEEAEATKASQEKRAAAEQAERENVDYLKSRISPEVAAEYAAAPKGKQKALINQIMAESAADPKSSRRESHYRQALTELAPQPAAAKPAKAEKQPWEMPLDEWRPQDAFKPVSEVEPNRGPTFDISNNTRQFQIEMEGERGVSVHVEPGGKTMAAFDRTWTTADARLKADEIQAYVEGRDWDPHRQAVERAVAEGKPVPAEVLKDYPDLAKPAKPVEAKAKKSAVDEAKALAKEFGEKLDEGEVTEARLRGEMTAAQETRIAAYRRMDALDDKVRALPEVQARIKKEQKAITGKGMRRNREHLAYRIVIEEGRKRFKRRDLEKAHDQREREVFEAQDRIGAFQREQGQKAESMAESVAAGDKAELLKKKWWEIRKEVAKREREAQEKATTTYRGGRHERRGDEAADVRLKTAEEALREAEVRMQPKAAGEDILPKGFKEGKGITEVTGRTVTPTGQGTIQEAVALGADAAKLKKRAKEPADYSAEPAKFDDVAEAMVYRSPHGIKKGDGDIGRLRRFMVQVPEFKLDPTFTVIEGGGLQFRDGGTFKWYDAKNLGILLPEGAKPGQKVRIDPDALKGLKVGQDFLLAKPGSMSVKPAGKVESAARSAAEAAKQRIAERSIRKGPQTPGARPGGTILLDNVVDSTIYGAAKIVEMTARGAKGIKAPNYREWVKSMLDDLGNPEFFGKWKEVIWRNARILARVRPQGWTTKEAIRLVTSSKAFTPDALRQRIVGIDERIAALKAKGETKGITPLLSERKELRGLIQSEGKLVHTPAQLLQYSMKHEARGSQSGYKQGMLDEMATVKDAREFIEASVPESERLMLKRVLDSMALRKVAKGSLRARIGEGDHPVGWTQFVKSVNRIMENYERREAIGQLKKTLKEAKDPQVDPTIKRLIGDLMEPYTIGKPRDAKVHEAVGRLSQSIRDWAERYQENAEAWLKAPNEIQADNWVTEIHRGILKNAEGVLRKLAKQDVKELKPDEIRALAAMVDNLLGQGRTKNKLIGQQKHREVQQLERTAREHVESHVPARDKMSPSERRERQTVVNTATKWLVRDWIDPLRQVEILAGRGDNALRDVFYDSFNRGQEAGSKFRRADQEAWAGFFEGKDYTPEDVRMWSGDLAGSKPVMRGGRVEMESKAEMITLRLPEARASKDVVKKGLGARQPTLKMTKAEAMDLLLHSWDPMTRREITRNKSEGIRLREGKYATTTVHLTNRDLIAIRQQIQDADPRMYELAKYLFSRMNDGGRRATVNRYTREMIGIDIANRTDHWPRVRDPEGLHTDPNKMAWTWIQAHLEQMNILKPRHSSSAPVFIEDAITKYFSHTNRIAALHKGPAIHDARRLLYGRTGRKFRDSIKQRFKHGQEYVNYLREYVRDYEGLDLRMDSVHESVANRALSQLARNWQVGRLGWNPKIGAYQRLSEVHLIAYYGLKAVRGGRGLKVPKEQVDAEIRGWSPLTLDRQEGGAHQILTPGLGRNTIRQFYGMSSGWEKTQESFMAMIRGIDATVIRDNWRAAKYEGMQKGLKGDELMRYTARRSEEIIDRSQPQFSSVSLAPAQRAMRKSPLLRGVPGNMFSAQRKQHFNMNIEGGLDFIEAKKITRLVDEGKLPQSELAKAKEYRKAGAAKWAAVNVANPIGVTLISNIYRIILGGAAAGVHAAVGIKQRIERDRPWHESMADVFSRAIGNLPGGLGAVLDWGMRTLYRKVANEKAMVFPLETPIGGAKDDFSRAFTKLERAIEEAAEEDGEVFQALVSLMQASMQASSATGIPGGPVEQQLRPFLPQPQWQRKRNLYANFWQAVDSGDEEKAKEIYQQMKGEGITASAVRTSGRNRKKDVPAWIGNGSGLPSSSRPSASMPSAKMPSADRP